MTEIQFQRLMEFFGKGGLKKVDKFHLFVQSGQVVFFRSGRKISIPENFSVSFRSGSLIALLLAGICGRPFSCVNFSKGGICEEWQAGERYDAKRREREGKAARNLILLQRG